MTQPPPQAPLRPRDLALVMLASRDLLPRQRARDQQADLAGLALKRRVLEQVAALDPEPAELEATLARIVEDLGQPASPRDEVSGQVERPARRGRLPAASAAPGGTGSPRG